MVGPDLLDFPRLRLCARLWAHNKENAVDVASRYILRQRSSGSFAVGVALALSHLWQDDDHEGLDPRRGLRRRED